MIIYKEETSEMSLSSVANEFAAQNDRRIANCVYDNDLPIVKRTTHTGRWCQKTVPNPIEKGPISILLGRWLKTGKWYARHRIGTGSHPEAPNRAQLGGTGSDLVRSRWHREAPWRRQIAPSLSGSVNWYATGSQLEANRRRQIAPNSGGPDLTR